MGSKIFTPETQNLWEVVELSNEINDEWLKRGRKIQKILGEKNKQLKSYFKFKCKNVYVTWIIEICIFAN